MGHNIIDLIRNLTISWKLKNTVVFFKDVFDSTE